MKTPTTAFPLNAWYAAAYDVEVRHALLPRTICNQKVVMFRRTDGQVAVLEDSCWHRLMPLSLGRLEGDELVCGYHGLVYNSQGRCTHMPSQETLNPSACVRNFPVVEKHRFVWIWPGDPAKADPALVPDMHWNDDPAWAGDGKMIRVNCDYRLVVDNLMDLTHETFVHGSSIGNREVAEAPFVATHGDRSATVTRWMENIDAPPFWGGQIRHARGYTGKVDRWQIIRFEGPCTVNIDVGVAEAGSGAVPKGDNPGDRGKGVNGYVLNTITPETDKTCLYFWAFARNYCIGEQRLTHELREGVAGIFREDELVLEAQQKAMDDHPDHQFYNLNIDAGSMWARRLIDRMVEKEKPARAAIPIRPAEEKQAA
ncbi:phenylpropionate dioxygenase-like ring-hydroxylating dioxygenase large terminal subunit [Variovorax boronicumulans]|uniref:aromatic ring-hydroxylating dioxygenase subunit alpha n=1 Tax=Variovorax boronicumulans TaxID=436515 RepID=UPI002476917B|nr:aromatic ring-hydroxylating dioxygenase subunit alpha [Variovorax boronicumulans]MDH6168044.1 phenylpropionate dioxygenase-like ring-hydroxylating dioxygenase large terminal subunit [Variovorax boronicumulans]